MKKSQITPTTFEESLAALTTPRERLFVQYYCGILTKNNQAALLNGSRAARFAGYSDKSSYTTAHENLRKPKISLAVKFGLETRAITRESVLAGVSEIANSSLDNLVRFEDRVVEQRVMVLSSEVLKDKRAELKLELVYQKRAKLSAAELKESVLKVKNLERDILKLDIRVKAEKNSVQSVLQAVVRTFPVIDLERVQSEGKMHLIKSIKHGKYGLEIEFYDAMHAKEMMGRHFKLWSDRVTLENPDGSPIKFLVGVSEEDL